ncbi:unnamed protein product [Effrenium voratum]|nr:unnamed protein product [Effrenium voratum]
MAALGAVRKAARAAARQPRRGFFGTEDPLSPRDGPLAEALGFVKKGRMDRALELAQQNNADSKALARECSRRAFAAYEESGEAREMAIGLVVGGSTFEIPGRDVRLIRPRQLVEGFWLRKVSDVHALAEGCKSFTKASLALGSEAPARDFQLLARSHVLRLQTCRTQAVLQAYIGKRIQGDGMLMRLPALWALLVKSGSHLRDHLLSPEPLGPLDGMEEAEAEPLQVLAEQRRRAAARHMEILTECISEAATSLFNPEDGMVMLAVDILGAPAAEMTTLPCDEP